MPENLSYIRDKSYDGPRTITPSRLYEIAPGLPEKERKLWPYCCYVYACLASQADKFQMGRIEIAKRLGISDNTVKRALDLLERYNILERLERKTFRNRYRFVEMAKWRIPVSCGHTAPNGKTSKNHKTESCDVGTESPTISNIDITSTVTSSSTSTVIRDGESYPEKVRVEDSKAEENLPEGGSSSTFEHPKREHAPPEASALFAAPTEAEVIEWDRKLDEACGRESELAEAIKAIYGSCRLPSRKYLSRTVGKNAKALKRGLGDEDTELLLRLIIGKAVIPADQMKVLRHCLTEYKAATRKG